MSMASDDEMLAFLRRSLENSHVDQLELYFWEVEGDQLVFA